MSSRIAGYVRNNAIAFAALFIALGGTSYAAVSLPRNSVGTPQLRNGAVTSSKLAGALGAQVWSVAQINGAGGRGMSDPRGVRIKDWQVTSTGSYGFVVYPRPFPKDCIPLATSEGSNALPNPEDTPSVSAQPVSNTEVRVYADSIDGITLAILCPRGA